MPRSEPAAPDAAPPRTVVALPVSLGLLGASLAAAIITAVAGVPVVSVDDLGALVVLTLAMAIGLDRVPRLGGVRRSGLRRPRRGRSAEVES